MRSARFSPPAARDLDEHCACIAATIPPPPAGCAPRFLDYADLVAQHPGIGRHIRNASPRHAQIRWLVVPPYRNYLVFFQPDADSIMVVRVLHAAQDWTRFFPRAASSA